MLMFREYEEQIRESYQDEEQIETRHDWRGHLDVLLQRLASVVTTGNRIGRGQN